MKYGSEDGIDHLYSGGPLLRDDNNFVEEDIRKLYGHVQHALDAAAHEPVKAVGQRRRVSCGALYGPPQVVIPNRVYGIKGASEAPVKVWVREKSLQILCFCYAVILEALYICAHRLRVAVAVPAHIYIPAASGFREVLKHVSVF